MECWSVGMPVAPSCGHFNPPLLQYSNRTSRASVARLALAAAVLLACRSAPADDPSPPGEDALAAAEQLWQAAHENRLSDAGAAQASEMLGHADPFVRGLAEWALALKVGAENNGQVQVHPKAPPPEWYRRFVELSPAARLEADWIRQAVAAGLHRDPAKLPAAVKAMTLRAERMAADYRDEGLGAERLAEVTRRIEFLRGLCARLADRIDRARGDRVALGRAWVEARRLLRGVVLAGPAVDFDEVVFAKRFAPHTVRNITRNFPWQHKPGGDICVLGDFRGCGEVREVLRGRLGPGSLRGMDLWWDADRVVFSFAPQKVWPPAVDVTSAGSEGSNAFELRKTHEPMHLYEVRLDGSGLKQLTDHPYWYDFEPSYLADGSVVFSSDRCARSAECGPFGYDIANANLYVLSADGAEIRQLTDNKDVDRYAHALSDGQIVYTHWEYQERHFMEVHSLWTARPDGRMSDAMYKHHIPAPLGLRDARSVPGSTKLAAVATGHHTFAHGPVVLVDTHHGMNDAAGLRVVTPGVKPQEGGMAGRPVDEGGVQDHGGLYATPWPLSEKCFLVAYAYARPKCTAPVGIDSNGLGLYLIDVYGNRELLWRDPLFSCVRPMAARKRPRPPLLPQVGQASCLPEEPKTSSASDRLEARPTTAVCLVADVYEGMPGVARGTIKHLRIAQHVGWPLDAERGMQPYMSAAAYARQFGEWSWSPVRVIGTVPVESDGSAHFRVPSDVAIYFQALDERMMEVRRMRSMVSFKPGEVRGCRGCHESRAATPVASGRLPLALGRLPDEPQPPPWGAERLLGYEWLVQPVLEKRCVRCHGAAEPDGGLDLSSTRAADGFLQSFRTMFGQPAGGSAAGTKQPGGKVLVSVSDRFSNSSVSQPKQFGSHRSRLVTVLLDDELHRKECPLEPDEWEALVTWVDANAPYHDRFINKRPGDGAPRRDVAWQRATARNPSETGRYPRGCP